MLHPSNNIFAAAQIVLPGDVCGKNNSLVPPHRGPLLAANPGRMLGAQVGFCGKDLHRDCALVLVEIKRPERLDYEAVNSFLIKARKEMGGRGQP
jgi:hypothetical protein